VIYYKQEHKVSFRVLFRIIFIFKKCDVAIKHSRKKYEGAISIKEFLHPLFEGISSRKKYELDYGLQQVKMSSNSSHTHVKSFASKWLCLLVLKVILLPGNS